MSSQTQQVETNLDATDGLLDPDRLYRMPRKVYQGIVKHGLLTPRDGVMLRGGLLVKKAAPASDIGPEHLYRMPLEVYHGIAERGLLTPRDKVVLLDGLLVKKMTRGAPHITVTQRLINALADLADGSWYARKEDPILLPGAPGARDSEPEPDVAVVRGRLEDYATQNPRGEDVLFVAEVCRSSVREDRKGMARYARAGIPVAWLFNLIDRNVEVYTSPSGPALLVKYKVMKVYGPDDMIPVVIDGREVGQIAVRDILR